MKVIVLCWMLWFVGTTGCFIIIAFDSFTTLILTSVVCTIFIGAIAHYFEERIK